MLDTTFRHKLQPAFNNIGKIFVKIGIQPITITTLSLLLGIAAGIAIALNAPSTAFICLWCSGLCDVLDGTVARLTTPTKTGAYCDLISDRMVESAFILGLVLRYPTHSFACVFFMVALLFHFSTFLVAGALFKNSGPKSMHYDKSIVERGEAFIIFSLILWFPAYLSFLLIGLSCVIFFSGLSRFIRVINHNQAPITKQNIS